jgi:hypothetical protein
VRPARGGDVPDDVPVRGVTHLTDSSLPWLLELHKLLKPDGLLIATYMGRFNGEVFTHEPWDEARIGMNVLRPDQGWDDGGPVVLMSDWWVHAHWGRAFEIVSLTPQGHGQTWVLLRKRDVEVAVSDLESPADDAREYVALKHNLTQVERDRERALDELRRRYEGPRAGASPARCVRRHAWPGACRKRSAADRGQPSAMPSTAADRTGSGRRIMRNAFNRLRSPARIGTTKATWSAMCRQWWPKRSRRAPNRHAGHRHVTRSARRWRAA